MCVCVCVCVYRTLAWWLECSPMALRVIPKTLKMVLDTSLLYTFMKIFRVYLFKEYTVTPNNIIFDCIMFTGNNKIDLMSRVFANGPRHQGLIPGGVISKIQKTVLDAALFNTQHYKVRIKGKVEQSRERSCAYTSV